MNIIGMYKICTRICACAIESAIDPMIKPIERNAAVPMTTKASRERRFDGRGT
jgi:hypothetical protein